MDWTVHSSTEGRYLFQGLAPGQPGVSVASKPPATSVVAPDNKWVGRRGAAATMCAGEGGCTLQNLTTLSLNLVSYMPTSPCLLPLVRTSDDTRGRRKKYSSSTSMEARQAVWILLDHRRALSCPYSPIRSEQVLECPHPLFSRVFSLGVARSALRPLPLPTPPPRPLL